MIYRLDDSYISVKTIPGARGTLQPRWLVRWFHDGIKYTEFGTEVFLFPVMPPAESQCELHEISFNRYHHGAQSRCAKTIDCSVRAEPKRFPPFVAQLVELRDGKKGTGVR